MHFTAAVATAIACFAAITSALPQLIVPDPVVPIVPFVEPVVPVVNPIVPVVDPLLVF